jgi:hypothetical protein
VTSKERGSGRVSRITFDGVKCGDLFADPIHDPYRDTIRTNKQESIVLETS